MWSSIHCHPVSECVFIRIFLILATSFVGPRILVYIYSPKYLLNTSPTAWLPVISCVRFIYSPFSLLGNRILPPLAAPFTGVADVSPDAARQRLRSQSHSARVAFSPVKCFTTHSAEGANVGQFSCFVLGQIENVVDDI